MQSNYLYNSIIIYTFIIFIVKKSVSQNKQKKDFIMFANIFNSVVDKLSGLNPIKSFIKYALDKFLNELINDEITLEDFKNSCLNLTGIGFNVDKINQKHLVSSPYILHSGSIGSLKIQLPSLSELSRKSIQIQVREIMIQLKPNKDFYKNFKQRIQDLRQNMAFDFQQSLPEEQISQNNPMDFFKQTLKHILLNIKVKVQNIVVKIYMNNPSENGNKNQFYLMMRIPTINVHKNNDLKIKPNKDLEEIKLDIQMPQFTIQLINNGAQFPQFSNQQFKKQEYPFKYPTINHPCTILLFGLEDFKHLNIETDKTIPRLTISVLTDYKNKRRNLKIDAVASSIEFMADPLQIKILSRFVHQIKNFKDIFNFIKHQLNIGQNSGIQQSVSQDLTSMKRNKSLQNKSGDIFSSICMSIWEPQSNGKSKISAKNRISNPIDSMIRQNSDLSKSISMFNAECSKQFNKQLQKKENSKEAEKDITSQLRVVNFQKNMEIGLQVNQVYLYVLKNTLSKAFYRKWMSSDKENKINQNIPSSHFMFSIKKMNFSMKQNGKMVELAINQLKLQNIKLFSHQIPTKVFIRNSENQFVDMQVSSQFFQSCKQSFQSFTSIQAECSEVDTNCISQFYLHQNDHFCVQQMIRISQKPSENYYSEKVRQYNFLPKSDGYQEPDHVIHKPGLRYSFNSTKKTPLIKIDILEIGVSLNSEILKQVLEIYFPVNQFQKLSASLNIQPISQLSQHPVQSTKDKGIEHVGNFKKRNLLQSQYNFGTEYITLMEFVQSREKPILKITVQQINLAFYESPLQQFVNLTQQYKQNHNQNGSCHHCFCNFNSKGLYFQCFGIEVDKKQEDLKISLRKIVSGCIQVANSKLKNTKALFSIGYVKKQKNQPERFLKVVIQKNQNTFVQNVFLVIPTLSVKIEEKQTLDCIQIIKRQVQVTEQIFSYFKYLKNSMDSISREAFHVQKKPSKKSKAKYELNLQLYVENLNVTVLKVQVLMKHIYLKKYTDQVVFKLSTLVLSMRQDIQLFLNQMKNQDLFLLQFIEKTSRYPSIRDSNIVLEINDEVYKPENFQSKNRQIFFQRLSKTGGSIVFNMSKNSGGSSIVNSKQKPKQTVISKGEVFQFHKKPTSKSAQLSSQSVIIEEEQLKKINLNVSSPVYISGSNVFRLLQNKQYLQQFIQKVKSLQHQILLQTKVLSGTQRKNSTDSDIEKLQQMEVQITAGKINIDIRPTFVERVNKRQEDLSPGKSKKTFIERQIVFSSSRSYLEIQWEQINIKLQKRIQRLYCSLVFNLRYHFLQHQQREAITNPIFLHQRQLKCLGFLEIFALKGLKLDLQKLKQNIRTKVEINSIIYQSSISTLSYLNLHIQHFVNHNIKRKFGLTVRQQEDRFQVLEQKQQSDQNNKQYKLASLQEEDSQNDDQILPVEDLTNAFQKYSQKINKKKDYESTFKEKKFTEPTCDKDVEFFLQLLKIKQFRVKIYSGNDFEFLSCESMNESKQKKRSRINDSQIFKYLQIRIDHFGVTAKVASLKESNIEAYTKIENLQVNFSNKKQAKGLFSRFIGTKNYSQQIVFPILRSQGQIKMLLEHNAQKTYVKLNKTSFQLGFTSEILQLVDEIKLTNETIKDSGWSKVYEENSPKLKLQIHQNSQSQPRLLLVHIPQNRLTIRLIYKGIQLLSKQSLYANEFLLHQESNNIAKINKMVIKWVKKLLMNNIGGLIGGSTLSFFGNVIEEILQVVKFLLGIVFKGNQISDNQ